MLNIKNNIWYTNNSGAKFCCKYAYNPLTCEINIWHMYAISYSL